jgi:hypothetical protein
MNILDDLLDLSDLISDGKKQKNLDAKAKQAKAQRERNAKMAKKLTPYTAMANEPGWEAQYQTVQIIVQHCAECESTKELVGAVTIHEQHKRVKTSWREINAPCSSVLSTRVRYHTQRVPCCADCLRVMQNGFDAVESHYTPTQLSLFS